MKKNTYRILYLLTLLLFIQGCSNPEQTFTYYRFHDEDGERIVTKIILEDRVYFVNSFYDKKEVPKAYITPVSGLDNYYVCYFYWEADKCYLITNMGKWYTIGNPQNFELIEKPSNYNSITSDKSGKYKLSTGNIIP